MDPLNTFPGFTPSDISIVVDLVSAALADPRPAVRRRADVLSELLGGLDVPLLVRLHHLSTRVVEAWRDRYNAEGSEGLADATPHQLPIEFPRDYQQQINTLLKADPLDYGYGPKDGWTVQRLSDEMDVITGVYLGKPGCASCSSPGATHRPIALSTAARARRKNSKHISSPATLNLGFNMRHAKRMPP